jgi:glycosyltransferase involved in cell wall biosynthesis
MKKKVGLFVIGSFKTGGAERMAINVGEELRRNGFDIHYALQRPVFELPNSIDIAKIHLLNKTTNHHKYILHLRNFVGILMLRLRLNPRFVVGFTYFSSFLACFTMSATVIGRFDINPYAFKRKLRHRIGTFVSKWPFVQKIIVPSHGLGNELKKVNGNFRKKITVIHNSIDFQQIDDLSREGNLEFPGISKPYVAAMGRLTHQKNYDLLLRAFAKSRISSRMGLVLIGDGALKAHLMSVARELKLEKTVHFTGFLSNPFPLIRGAELFINTSDFESFCNVIVEALSLATPVVATDCPFGPSEIVVHGHNGLMFGSNNEDELVSILNRIDTGEVDLSSLRENSIESVKKFHLDTIGREWVKLLENV